MNDLFERVVDNFIITDGDTIRTYITQMRQQHPDLNTDQLARRIVRDKAWRSGLIGAATGLGGILALPITLPADVILSWRLQIAMTYAIAHAYGHDTDNEALKATAYSILAGESAKESVKRVSVAMAQRAALQALRDQAKTVVWKQVRRRLLRRTVLRSTPRLVPRLFKAVPLMGVPIGFAFNWWQARAVGRTAIRHYSKVSPQAA